MDFQEFQWGGMDWIAVVLVKDKWQHLWIQQWSLLSHHACCHTCYMIQLMHYSHF